MSERDFYDLSDYSLSEKSEQSEFFTQELTWSELLIKEFLSRGGSAFGDRYINSLRDLCRQRFFTRLESRCNNLAIYKRPVANFAPKYQEYKIFFKDYEQSLLTENVCGYGQSFFSEEVALAKATGEFLERYFLYDETTHATKIQIASAADLGSAALDLSHASMYSKEQQKKVAKNFLLRDSYQSAQLSWVQGRSVLTGKKRYIPAQRVFWGRKVEAGEAILNHQTSNGNAGAFSKTQAIGSALAELVERDCFMEYWLLQKTPCIVRSDTIFTPGYQKIKPMLSRYKLDVTFFLFTSSIQIPTVVCMVVDQSDVDDPKISFGASTSYDVQHLFDNSLLEALVVQRHHLLQQIRNEESSSATLSSYFYDTKFDNDFHDRLVYWRGKERFAHLSFWHASDATITYQAVIEKYQLVEDSTPTQQLDRLTAEFNRLVKLFGPSYEPGYYEVTDSFLKKIGYTVVSVTVPALFPLYLREHMITLDISAQLHWELSRKKELLVKNLSPHPFP